MKTGILSVPSGFRECFPSQNKFLNTKRLLEMAALLITMLYSVICQVGWGGGLDRKNRSLYFNFLVPVLSPIKKNPMEFVKRTKSHEHDMPSLLCWLPFKGKELQQRGCCHTHIIMALTMLTSNINWTIKGFKCSSLTFISLIFLKNIFSFLLKLKMSIPFDFCTPSRGIQTKEPTRDRRPKAPGQRTPQIMESVGEEFQPKSQHPSYRKQV